MPWLASLLALMAAVAVRAEPAVHEPLDGPATHWQLVETEEPARIVVHETAEDPGRPSSPVERLVVEAAGGTSVLFEFPVPRAAVLDELQTAVWVKANQPGVSLAARVVLPRAVDPETGQYRTVLVRGLRYEAAPFWQQLKLTDLPTKVQRQVRVLRLEASTPIDQREAFVDRLVLVVPGSPRGTEVFTDDLTLDGVLLADVKSPQSTTNGRSHAAGSASDKGVIQVGWTDDVAVPQGAGGGRLPPRVQVRSSILQIDGRPFFPRAITPRGEPLDLLAELGFNTVLHDRLPGADECQHAERLQLWQLSPPPSAAELAGGQVVAANTFPRILAWYLDAEAAALPAGQLRQWVEAIRGWDRDSDRPILLAPQVAVPDRQRLVDAVVLGRGVWGGRREMQRNAEWLGQQMMLTGPGMPVLMRIQLTPDQPARTQAAPLINASGAGAAPIGIDEQQIDLLAKTAAASGCRGFVVHSEQPLTSADPLTKRYASALALANLQLDLLDPWLVGGKVIGTATSSNPNLVAVVLQVEQARLVVPLDWSAAEGATATALTVPGVPESNRAFLLTPASMTPLDHRRVAGGIRVIVDPRTEGFVLLTEDPSVIATLRQRVQRTGGRAAELSQELAAARLEIARQLVPPTAADGQTNRPAVQILSRAGAHLGQSDQLLKAGNATAAFLHAMAAARLTGESFVRQLAPRTDGALLLSLPIRPALDTLPAYAALARSLASRPPGDNRLYGGDFEDLPRLLEFGWQHVDHAVPGVRTHVVLSTVDPHHGKYSLTLTAEAADAERAPAALAEPPLWIKSPALPATAGEWMEITGWIRIDTPIAAHADGLEIVDSLGGRELAVHVRQTNGWQPFRMVRHVPSPAADLQLTFALNGLGTAHVDAVMVRPLGGAAPSPPAAVGITSTPPAGNSPATQARRPQRLFGNPALR